MNKKILMGAVVVIILFGGYFLLENYGKQNISDKNSIKLGFMLPLTGQFSAIGDGLNKAGILAVEDYEKANPNINVQVVSEDDGFDVKKGIPAYTKLTTLDKVNGIMMISTPIIDAMYKKMNQDGLPIVSIGLQNDGISDDNIFQMTMSPIAPMEKLGKFVNGKNHKKIAVVYNTTLTAIVKFHDAFLRNYNNPHEDFVVNDEQTAKVTATKIIYGDFDSVIIFQDGLTGPAVTKELKNLDKSNKLTYYFDGQLGSAWGEYKKLLGDTNKLNGSYFFKIKTQDLSVFKEKYKARFGSDPAPYAEYGYDSAMLILNTYDKDNKTWEQKIENTNYKGFSGAVNFDNQGIRLQEAVITTVQNGSI